MPDRDGRRDEILAQLAELALGLLDPDERTSLETEIAASPELSAELEAVRRTLARLDDDIEPIAPGAALRERVLGLASGATRFEGFVDRMARLFDFSRERAREILSAIGDPAGGWEAPGIPGVRLLHFDGGPEVAGADCGLVEVAPGVAFPRHVHHGGEWSLNLQGRAMEDSGRIFEPGDLIFRAEGGRHAFESIGEEPYVFAVVLYGGFHPDDDSGRTPS